MDEAKLDARSSQGLVNRAEAVDQQFGDRQEIDTQGGDAAGRDIHKSTIINIIVPSGENGSSHQVIQELLRILGQSDSAESVGKAYRSSLPPDSQVWRPRIDNSRTDHSRTDHSEKMVAQIQEFGKLSEFVGRLVQDQSLPQSSREQLEKLMPQGNLPDPVQTIQEPQPYLLVVLDPDPGTDRFFANAWLVPDDTVQDPLTRFVQLDLAEDQKGKSCSLDQISEVIGKFLIQSEDYLIDRGNDNHPTIEVFLPRDYLTTKVEFWEILDAVDGTPLPIGTMYSVLVRSYERIQRKYLRLYRKQWRTHWDRVKQNLAVIPSCEMFEPLDRLETCNERTLTASLQTKLGLKLTCSPTAKHKEFFTSILKAAVPIAIWSRSSLPDLATEIDLLLTSGSLMQLIDRIRQKRQEAPSDCEHHLGHHLTILWEDIDRLPPIAELQQPGQ
ncbi:VMAP-C domain-containing protein [Leptolyngbya ohadii]|uniref:VMAP-C domain-containing protein n=1 Tax=Leptolyngbya ohadii TaxID=1962290 RepID=UPI000B5A1CF4|nr:hypothetical protein [Leptolyngbya ohadii]